MPSPFQPAAVRFFYRSPTGIVARWNNVLIQYRNGPLSADVIDAAVRASEGLGPEEEVAALSILDGKASIPSSELRSKQRDVIQELLDSLNGRIAIVITGDDVWTQLLRSAARLVVVGNPRVTMAKSVDDAIRWLAPVGASTAGDITAFWGFVRTTAEEQAG